MSKENRKPGPKPDRLKIEEPWEKAVRKAVQKKKPEKGWPPPRRPDNDSG